MSDMHLGGSYCTEHSMGTSRDDTKCDRCLSSDAIDDLRSQLAFVVAERDQLSRETDEVRRDACEFGEKYDNVVDRLADVSGELAQARSYHSERVRQ